MRGVEWSGKGDCSGMEGWRMMGVVECECECE